VANIKQDAFKESTWKKESGFIWSMIGSAVGFANILSFSAHCYKNGGAAFLIPYILAYLIVGLPMLFLEGVIGQRTKLPLVSAMGTVAGIKGKMFGWLAILTCATIGGFYIVLTGFAVAYTYFSAAGTIGPDSAYFFKHTFLHDSGSIKIIGGIAAPVLLSTLIVVAIAWIVLAKNIQTGIEKLCSFFLPLLGLLIGIFLIATFFLPGATTGFKHYLIPQFDQLKSWTLWRDVFGQLFFSLSLGLGIVTGYSRYNPSSFSIKRAMVRVAIGDFLISFIAGLVIFGSIGYLSHKTDLPFSSIITSDSAFEIGFVIFPTILSQFGGMLSRIIGPIFFFCVFIAGITGVFSIVESVAGNFEIEFRKKRKTAVAFAMLLIGALAVPFCLGNGQHLIGAIAPMVLGDAMLIGGIAEIILFLLLSQSIRKDPIWMAKNGASFSLYALKYLVLPLLFFSLIAALWKELSNPFGISESVRFAWLFIVLLATFFLARKRSHLRLHQSN